MGDAGRLFRVPPAPAPPRPLAHGGRKVRVAFLSCYLRNHTIGELMRGLIARLARRDFEVIVLTPVRHDDVVSRFIKDNCDRYIELPFGLEAQRRAIRELALDVLFYTDVGMDRATYALAFSRLAPVQCVTWGHPSTTGSPAIDYFVSSALFESEQANGHYSEALVRLRSMPFWCSRPEPPPAPKTREQLGLPPGATIYGCPQSLFKLHPEFDALLAGILRADPRGRVVLNQDRHPFYGHWEKLLRERFAASIPDVADRVLFLPRLSHADYLSLNLATDVLLDPLHFTGGNTSLKALALGVPIVTLPGTLLKSRMTAAFYQRMGVTEAIASTPEEYVRLAVRLGTEPEARRALSRKIREANAVLYDNVESVRDLEAFLHQAMARAR
jgi:predicted O-linked N-acetylglucosamine transferase (SPINDLY family)